MPELQPLAEGPIRALDASPDGRLLATGDDFGTATLWDAETLQSRASFPSRAADSLGAVRFTPDSATLLVGWKTMQGFDTTTGKKSKLAVRGHKAAPNAIAWCPDGALATAGGSSIYSDDCCLRLWEPPFDGKPKAMKMPKWKPSWSDTALPAGALCIDASADGEMLAVGAEDGLVRLVHRQSMKPLRELDLGGEVRAVRFGPGGVLLAAGRGRAVKVWSADGEPIADLDGAGLEGVENATSTVHALALSRDGSLLLSARNTTVRDQPGGEYRVHAWDTATWTARGHIDTTVWTLYQVALTPDGRRFIVCGQKGAQVGSVDDLAAT